MQKVYEHELVIGNRYDIIVTNDKKEYKYNGVFNGINSLNVYDVPLLNTFTDVIDYNNKKQYKMINFQYNILCPMTNEYFIPDISLQKLCWNKLSPNDIGYLKDLRLNKISLGIP